MDVSLYGVGTSTFGRQRSRRIDELAWAAVTEALDDAKIELSEIDAVYVGNVYGPTGLAPMPFS